jgi:hypothetical protein
LATPAEARPFTKINHLGLQTCISAGFDPKKLSAEVANPPRPGSLNATWCGDVCTLTFTEGALTITVYRGTSRAELFAALSEYLENGVALRAA